MRIRGLSLILSIILIFTIIGCSSNNKKAEEKDGYIEGQIDMPVKLNELHTIKKIDDGSLVFVGANSEVGASGYATRSDLKVYVSKDQGQSWAERKVELPNIDGTQVFFYGLTILNDGRILLCCDRLVSGATEYSDFIIDKEGKYSEIKIRDNQSDYLSNFISLNNGDIIYKSKENEITEIDGKTFEKKKIYNTKNSIDSFSVVGDNIIIKSPDLALSRININSNTEEELVELNKDIKSRIKEKELFPYFLIPTESKNKIYCYNPSEFQDGLVSYDFDKKKFEFTIPKNNNLSTDFVLLNSLIELKSDEFIFAANISADTMRGALLKYTYEKNINLKPKIQLTVYSLREDSNIRKSIANFNLNNKEVLLNYEIGITEGSGVTEADAIKTLNTELMAGKGPDLLLLDGLPIESYENQGILADVSTSVKKYEKELFGGIVDAYRVKGKIYTLPMNISIPLIVAEKPLVNRINDINSLEEVFEELDTKGDKLIMNTSIRTPEAFISSVYYMFENNWLDNKNNINKENLLRFMEKSKNVYTTSNNQIKANDKKVTEKEREKLNGEGASESQISTLEVKSNEINGIHLIQPITPIVTKEDYLQYGPISDYTAYEDILLQKIYNEEIGYKVFQKSNENIFIPSNTLSVNNNSKNKKIALEAFEELVLKNKGNNGVIQPISINKNAFVQTLGINENQANELEFDKDKNRYIKEKVTYVDDDGKEKQWYRYWPNDEDIKSFTDEIDKLNVKPELNSVLLTEVCNQFTKVINEGLSPEEAVDNVVKNLELYLAE